MISPHAHISMTYMPAVEPKHVHRVEKPKRESRKRRTFLAQRLHLVPRHA
jgi:hypothetical protein